MNCRHALVLVLAPLVASLLAAGCAGTPTSVQALTPARLADPARGTILVSTAAAARCTALASWGPIYDAATHKLAAGTPVIPIDEHASSDYPDHYGSLSALSLPAGRYLMAVEATNPGYEDIDVPSFGFEVVAGHTRYLGTLLRLTPCNRLAKFTIVDRYEDDVALATRLNPAFASHPPERALMEFVRTSPRP